MYGHPGRVLKGIGTAIFFILLIVTIVGSIPLFSLAKFNGIFILLGLVEIVLGVLLAYVIGLFLAAFGELVENSTTIAYYVKQSSSGSDSYNSSMQSISANDMPSKPASSQTVSGVKVCSICGTVNKAECYICVNCGMGLPSTIQASTTSNTMNRSNTTSNISKFKTCPHCGEKNRSSDRHCSKCGKQI